MTMDSLTRPCSRKHDLVDAASGAGFRLWILGLGRTKPHRLKPAPQVPSWLHVVALGRKVPRIDLDRTIWGRVENNAPFFMVQVEFQIHNSRGLRAWACAMHSAQQQSPHSV